MEAGSLVQPAPGELELVRRFVNTNDIDDGIDELTSGERLAEWLEAHGLPVEGDRPTDPDAARARDVREALRALLLANSGEPLDRAAIASLNAAAERVPLQLRFEADAAALGPQAGGFDGALGTLLAIVYRAIEEGTFSRLKACREDTCQWAFYDTSRNRSAHWCTMAVCGNRAKARAYRQRRSPKRSA